MNKFIGTLVDTVQVRNGSEVQDVSPAVKQNVSSILTTLSEDPKVAPADKVAGEEPVANITRRDTSLSLAPRRLYFDPDLFIKTGELLQICVYQYPMLTDQRWRIPGKEHSFVHSSK